MVLDLLPDTALRQIFSYCNARDIISLQMTSRRFLDHIKHYRIYYSKSSTLVLQILEKVDYQYKVKVVPYIGNEFTITTSIEWLKSLNPRWLYTENYDEIVNLSWLWWKYIRILVLENIIDYQKYLPHFDRCTQITIRCKSSIDLSVVLQTMETKHLQHFSVSSETEVKCTDDDLRKIGRLSNQLSWLVLDNLSETSEISNDAVLDMVEFGYFPPFLFRNDIWLVPQACIRISRIQNFDKMDEIAKKRSWVTKYNRDENVLGFQKTNGAYYSISTDD